LVNKKASCGVATMLFYLQLNKEHHAHTLLPIFPPTKRVNGMANTAKKGRSTHSKGSEEITQYILRSMHVSTTIASTQSYTKDIKLKITPPSLDKSLNLPPVLEVLLLKKSRNRINRPDAGVCQRAPMPNAKDMSTKKL
jgi:hypothetical protein